LILRPFQGFGAAFVLFPFALSGRWFVCALSTQGAAALALNKKRKRKRKVDVARRVPTIATLNLLNPLNFKHFTN